MGVPAPWTSASSATSSEGLSARSASGSLYTGDWRNDAATASLEASACTVVANPAGAAKAAGTVVAVPAAATSSSREALATRWRVLIGTR